MKTMPAGKRNRVAVSSLCLLAVAGLLAAPLNASAAGCRLGFRGLYEGAVGMMDATYETAVGDFNGDGHADLAVTLFGANQVLIYNGDGAGHFALPATYSTGGYVETIAVGDFNGDGKPDLVVGNIGSAAPGLGILLNNGSGGFATPVLIPEDDPFQVVVADFNRDGKQDIAVPGPASTMVYLGDGHGGFSAPVVSPGGGGGMVVGDFNGDGIPDLAVVLSGSLEILLGSGTGTFALANTYPLGSGNPTRVVTADFNHDGKADLAVAVINGPYDVATFLGDGTGHFAASVTVPFTDAEGLVAIDIDGDGKVDLATADYSSPTVSVAKGNGRGRFGAVMSYPLPAKPKKALPINLTTGDFNEDGLPDLVASDYIPGGVTVLLTTCGAMQ